MCFHSISLFQRRQDQGGNQGGNFVFFFPPHVEKDELYSKAIIAYNLIQKERSNGNIK